MKNILQSNGTKMITKIATLIIAMVAVLPTIALASGPGFNGGVNDGGVCVPLDGGLSLLAAAGIGYGVKLYASAKNAKQNSEA